MIWAILAVGGFGAVNSSLNGHYKTALLVAAATTGAVLTLKATGGAA